MTLHALTTGHGPQQLVLLHGWGFHGGIWEDLAGRLAEGRRVTRLDLPGHGASAMLEGNYDLAALAAAVADAIADRAAVLGWSLGGMVALTLAAHHPERVTRLALVSSTPQFIASHDWPHGIRPGVLEQFAESLLGDHHKTLQRFLALQVMGCRDERTLQRQLEAVAAAAAPPHPEALRGGLAILRSARLQPLLERITCPCLVICGQRDTLVPAAAGAALCRLLPTAQLAVIAGAAHVPFLSHAEEFTRLLEDFLDD